MAVSVGVNGLVDAVALRIAGLGLDDVRTEVRRILNVYVDAGIEMGWSEAVALDEADILADEVIARLKDIWARSGCVIGHC